MNERQVRKQQYQRLHEDPTKKRFKNGLKKLGIGALIVSCIMAMFNPIGWITAGTILVFSLIGGDHND